MKQNSNLWVLLWLCKTEIWRENKTTLYIRTVLLYTYKNRWYLQNITKDNEKRFDTLNYELQRPSPNEKNKNVIGLTKDKLGGKILKELTALRIKTYSYLKNNKNEDKNT